MDKKLIAIFILVITVLSLVIALVVSNSYWMIKVKNIEIKQEQEKTAQAKEYAKKLEFQRELTKSSIETVTQETNHYMYINEQLQGENDALRKDINNSLRDDKCANSDIPNAARQRMYTK